MEIRISSFCPWQWLTPSIYIDKESLFNHRLADPRGNLGMTTHSAPAFYIASVDFKNLVLASWKALSPSIFFAQYWSVTPSKGSSSETPLSSTLARGWNHSFLPSTRTWSTRKSDGVVHSKIIRLLLMSSVVDIDANPLPTLFSALALRCLTA